MVTYLCIGYMDLSSVTPGNYRGHYSYDVFIVPAVMCTILARGQDMQLSTTTDLWLHGSWTVELLKWSKHLLHSSLNSFDTDSKLWIWEIVALQCAPQFERWKSTELFDRFWGVVRWTIESAACAAVAGWLAILQKRTNCGYFFSGNAGPVQECNVY